MEIPTAAPQVSAPAEVPAPEQISSYTPHLHEEQLSGVNAAHYVPPDYADDHTPHNSVAIIFNNTGVAYIIPLMIAKTIPNIRDAVEETGIRVFPIDPQSPTNPTGPATTAQGIYRALQWADYHFQHPVKYIHDADGKNLPEKLKLDKFDPFDKQLFDAAVVEEQSRLDAMPKAERERKQAAKEEPRYPYNGVLDVILAANYLGMTDLLDNACKFVAMFLNNQDVSVLNDLLRMDLTVAEQPAGAPGTVQAQA